MRAFRICFCAAIALALISISGVRATEGSAPSLVGYIGKVVTEWLADGRKMRILEPFAFVSSSGLRWDVPAGSVVDGASIPKIAWSIVGGPFEGLYRNASVIHDVACEEKKQRWQDVHAVFHEAMLESGVGKIKAEVMYAAVYHFGPRWEERVVLQNVTEAELNQRAWPMLGSSVVIESEPLPSPPCTNPPCAPYEPRFNASLIYEPEPPRLSEAQFDELKALIESGADVSVETFGYPDN